MRAAIRQRLGGKKTEMQYLQAWNSGRMWYIR